MPRSSPSNAAAGDASAPPDYSAAREGRAHRLRDIGVVAVGGPDRADFLQGQLTQDVKGLGAGQSRPAAGLSPKGKILYWGRALAAQDEILLLVPAGVRAAVAAHLGKYAVFQKVTLRDASAELVEVGLYGPHAADLTRPADAVVLPAEGEFAASWFGAAGLREDWLRRLEAAGSQPVAEATAAVLRVEAGRPRLGQDADDSNLLDEIGLSAAISTTKGCYVGQEVVARLRTYGRVNRRLVGFRFPDEAVPERTVFGDPEKPGHELGRITSAVLSPRFGAIGLGLAFREVPAGGSLRDPSHPQRVAVVSSLPFA